MNFAQVETANEDDPDSTPGNVDMSDPNSTPGEGGTEEDDDDAELDDEEPPGGPPGPSGPPPLLFFFFFFFSPACGTPGSPLPPGPPPPPPGPLPPPPGGPLGGVAPGSSPPAALAPAGTPLTSSPPCGGGALCELAAPGALPSSVPAVSMATGAKGVSLPAVIAGAVLQRTKSPMGISDGSPLLTAATVSTIAGGMVTVVIVVTGVAPVPPVG